MTEGKTFDDHSLIVGSPAKAIRTLDKEAVAKLRQSAAHYVENRRHSRWDEADRRRRNEAQRVQVAFFFFFLLVLRIISLPRR